MRHETSSRAAGTITEEWFGPARDVPDNLQQYLTTTDVPNEIYCLVHQDRDQQLRRLTRRFFNQIQYGCKNGLCDARTCLSYRRRVTSSPFRPYTDIAARALAAKCVEHYAGEDSNIHSRLPPRHTSVYRLCQNQPVIPWETDAKEYLARKDAAAKKNSSTAYKQANDAPKGHDHRSPGQGALGSVNPTKIPSVEISDKACSLSDTAIKRGLIEFRDAVKQEIARPGAIHTCNSIRAAALAAIYAPSSLTHSPLWKQTSREVIQDEFEKARVEDALRRAVRRSSINVWQPQHSMRQIQQRTVQALNLPPNFFHRDRWKSWSEYIISSEFGHRGSYPARTIVRDQQLGGDQAGPKHGAPALPQQPERTTDPFDPASLPQYLFKYNPRLCYLTHHNSGPKSIIDPVHTFNVLTEDATRWLQKVCTSSVRFDNWRPFAEQSVYYVLSNARRLLTTASYWYKAEMKSTNEAVFEHAPPRLPDVLATRSTFLPLIMTAGSHSDFNRRVFSHLDQMLRQAYNPPPWLADPSSSQDPSYITNAQVAYLMLLTSTIACELVANELRMSGRSDSAYIVHEASFMSMAGFMCKNTAHDQSLLRLLTTIADVISHRIAVDVAYQDRIQKIGKRQPSEYSGILEELKAFLMRSKCVPRSLCFPRQLLENMRLVVRTRWDRQPVIHSDSPVAGALRVVQVLCDVLILSEREHNPKTLDSFVMDDIWYALDKIDTPYEWLGFQPSTTHMHILQFPFLLGFNTAWNCFRSINLKVMKDSHDQATMVSINSKRQLITNPLSPWKVNNAKEVFDKIRPEMARYFVLTVSRESVLEDAIGQIWHRQHRELTRPLKVRMGVDEGEQGLDHGGVQQEFFRLIFREAFSAKYGMFDTDPKTYFSWFKPGALEPVYKYEALGLLMSLAVYNGVTVPVNLPLAFYRKVLNVRAPLIWQQIEDAWPDLMRSLVQLNDWKDGDVGDVICRTYEFSYEAFGQIINIDMSKEDDSCNSQKIGRFPAMEAPLVTNTNREDYIKDYIYYLTEKSVAAQLNAFLKGLYALLSPKALSLFSPDQLKVLIEGRPDTELVKVEEWREITSYEDYSKTDQVIVWFWEVLEQDFTQKQLRKLLEFVTASDRLPVTGWDGVKFVIQRHAEDNFLPGSSTCYGRLFLPEYESKQVLKEKLELAIENSLGFGQV